MSDVDSTIISDNDLAPTSDYLERAYVAKTIGIEDETGKKKFQDQIGRLIEYARHKGASNADEMTIEIKRLMNRVGTPIGIHLARHLSTYAYLEMERDRLDQQLQELATTKK